MSIRRVAEAVQNQGEDESVVYSLITTPWGSNPISPNFKIYENHRYVSLTGHFFGVLLLVCNRQWFDSLSAKQQRTVDAAVAMATQQQRTLAAQQDSALLTELAQRGVQILSSSDLDRVAMRSVTAHIIERERQTLSKPIVQHYLDLQRA